MPRRPSRPPGRGAPPGPGRRGPPPRGRRPPTGRPPSGRGGGPPRGGGGRKPPPRKRPPRDLNDPRATRGRKTFEIVKGKRPDDEEYVDVNEPLGPVMLPQSMTGEAEEESLKRRFGVEQLPEVDKKHSLLRLTDSGPSSLCSRRSWRSRTPGEAGHLHVVDRTTVPSNGCASSSCAQLAVGRPSRRANASS